MLRLFILSIVISSISSIPFNFFHRLYTTRKPYHEPRYDPHYEPDSHEDGPDNFFYNPFYGHESYFPVGHPSHNHPPGHPWHRPPQHKPTTMKTTTAAPTTTVASTTTAASTTTVTPTTTAAPTTTAPKRAITQKPTESPLNEYPWDLGNDETPSDGPTIPINPPVIVIHHNDNKEKCKSNCGATIVNQIPNNPSVLIIRPDKVKYDIEAMPGVVQVKKEVPKGYPVIYLHHRFEKPYNVKDSVISQVKNIMSVPVNLSIIDQYGPGGTKFATRMSSESNNLPPFQNLGDFIQKKVIVRNRLTDVLDLDVTQKKNDDALNDSTDILKEKPQTNNNADDKVQEIEDTSVTQNITIPDEIITIQNAVKDDNEANKPKDLELMIMPSSADLFSTAMQMTANDETTVEEKRDVSNTNDLVQQINSGTFNSSLLLIPAGIQENENLDPEEVKKIQEEISGFIANGLVTYYQNQLMGDGKKEDTKTKTETKENEQPCEMGDPYAINIRTKCKTTAANKESTTELYVGPIKEDLRYGKIKT